MLHAKDLQDLEEEVVLREKPREETEGGYHCSNCGGTHVIVAGRCITCMTCGSSTCSL